MAQWVKALAEQIGQPKFNPRTHVHIKIRPVMQILDNSHNKTRYMNIYLYTQISCVFVYTIGSINSDTHSLCACTHRHTSY